MTSPLAPRDGNDLNQFVPERRVQPNSWSGRRELQRAKEATNRQLDAIDTAAEVQAYLDVRRGHVELNRTHVNTVVEKGKAQGRADLARDAAVHVQGVHNLVTGLSAGDMGLEIELRAIENAFVAGEQQRIIQRGMEG